MITLLNGEKFYPIEGYEGLYEISNKYRVKSLKKSWNKGKMVAVRTKEDTILKRQQHPLGYWTHIFCKDGVRKTHQLHRVVAKAFIPNPLNLPFVNHKNAQKDDVRVENLEWCTHLENIRHAINLGLKHYKGDLCSTAKLTEEKVLQIRKLHSEGVSMAKLALKYNVKHPAIFKIINRQRWNHI